MKFFTIVILSLIVTTSIFAKDQTAASNTLQKLSIVKGTIPAPPTPTEPPMPNKGLIL